MSRRIILALSCAVLAFGATSVAGCGGSKKSDTSASTTEAAPTTTPAAAETGTVNVVMQNNFFSPEKITVKVGQKIHWTNNDSYPHTVTATKGATFNSKSVNGNGTFDFTPRKAGTIAYICTIHSNQKGTITVTQ